MYHSPFSQIAEAFTEMVCRSKFWQLCATASAWLALYFLLPLGVLGRLALEVRGGMLPRVLGGKHRVVENLADAYPDFATWFVPETALGWCLTAFLVACAFVCKHVAENLRKQERAY